MPVFRNLLYLGYFILKTNYSDLKGSIFCTHKRYKKNRMWLLLDMAYSTLFYGSSFVDYFNFQFYTKTKREKSAYATMGYMYRFHKKLNDPGKIKFIDSKQLFPVSFKKYCNTSYNFTLDNQKELITLLNSKVNQRIVIKDPESTAGKSIRILPVTKNHLNLFIQSSPVEVFIYTEYKNKRSLYIEDYVTQHKEINAISPSGLNTIRVITLIDDQRKPIIIGSVFRISVNSEIDNYSAGNLAAEVDHKTGIVVTGGIKKQSSCDEYHDFHPITGGKIKGFQLPYWKEVVSMVLDAATVCPDVRTVGWDVAITDDGPILIEGNSQWNKDTWQIPAGFGKKHLIAEYL